MHLHINTKRLLAGLFIVLFVSGRNCPAQNTANPFKPDLNYTDSLRRIPLVPTNVRGYVNSRRELALYFYGFGRFDSTIKYAKACLNVNKNNTHGEEILVLKLAWAYKRKGLFNEALNTVKPIPVDKMPPSEAHNIADFHLLCATCRLNTGDILEAREHAKQALKYAEPIGTSAQIARAYYTLGNILGTTEANVEVEKLLLKAKSYVEAPDTSNLYRDKTIKPEVYLALSNCYLNMHNWKAIEVYYQKALQSAQESGDSTLLLEVYSHQYNRLRYADKVDEANKLLMKRIAIIRNFGLDYEMAHAYYALASSIHREKEPAKYRSYLDSCIAYYHLGGPSPSLMYALGTRLNFAYEVEHDYKYVADHYNELYNLQGQFHGEHFRVVTEHLNEELNLRTKELTDLKAEKQKTSPYLTAAWCFTCFTGAAQ